MVRFIRDTPLLGCGQGSWSGDLDAGREGCRESSRTALVLPFVLVRPPVRCCHGRYFGREMRCGLATWIVPLSRRHVNFFVDPDASSKEDCRAHLLAPVFIGALHGIPFLPHKHGVQSPYWDSLA